jgi:hypothetical protein
MRFNDGSQIAEPTIVVDYFPSDQRGVGDGIQSA